MNNFIKSKSNENIKYTSKLLSSAKFRRENRQFVIEGLRLCNDALKSGVKIRKVFYTDRIYKKSYETIDKITAVCGQAFVTDEKIMKIISDTDCPQGIVCICDFIDCDLNLKDHKNRIIILDNIQNPSNLGSIIRTCDALNFDGAVISENSCDIYNPKALRGSMGSVFRTKFLIKNLEEIIPELDKKGIMTVAMTIEDGSLDIRTLGGTQNIALVIGNEGNGIRDEIKNICTCKSKIPISGGTDSLNAAVAAGIAMWEVTRTRE